MLRFKVKYIVYIWIFLLMFSNLFDRMMGSKVPSTLFYLTSLILIIACLIIIKFNSLLIAVSLLPIFFFGVLIFHPLTPFKANVMSIKDFILPLISLWVPLSLIKDKNDKKKVINVINNLFLIFVCYGLFQEICFYTCGGINGLAKYLPWDYHFVVNELNTPGGAKNLFQGSLLRFSGPMNSFVEGQVFVVVILSLLLKYKKFLVNNFVFKLNLVFGFTFLVLALERTPIFMLVIILFIWNVPKILRFKFVLRALIIVSLLAVISFEVYNRFQNNEEISTAIERLMRTATFQFKEDPAIQMRMEDRWEKSIQLAETSFWGLGPARISPSARNMIDNYVAPHNNFFAYYLGYGFVGLFLFLSLLITIIFYGSNCKSDTKYLVWGIVIAYVACAIFNLPFLGKNGILFFFTVAFVLSSDKLISIQTRIKRNVVKNEDSC